jgi:hypothetical protein
MSEKMKEVPGIYLSNSELKSEDAITFKWRPNAKYAWACGRMWPNTGTSKDVL